MRYAVIFALLSGCAAPSLPPEINRDGTSNAPFLDFLTAGELAAVTAELPQIEATAASPLAGRLARLRTRAAILRGPIFTGGDRARLIGDPG